MRCLSLCHSDEFMHNHTQVHSQHGICLPQPRRGVFNPPGFVHGTRRQHPTQWNSCLFLALCLLVVRFMLLFLNFTCHHRSRGGRLLQRWCPGPPPNHSHVRLRTFGPACVTRRKQLGAALSSGVPARHCTPFPDPRLHSATDLPSLRQEWSQNLFGMYFLSTPSAQ